MNRRSRALIPVLVRVPGCLALLSGLLLGAAGHASAGVPAAGRPGAGAPADHVTADGIARDGLPAAGPEPVPMAPVPVRVPRGAGDQGAPAVSGRVSPVESEVARDENGDFVLTVTNTGTSAALDVRALLDDGTEGNTVGSPDGRCLSRLDASSPADLWCELGDLAPGQTATVDVHAYMYHCVWLDPGSPGSQLHAPAFRWRIGYTDDGQAKLLSEPTPRWTCADDRVRTDLDIAEAVERP